MAKNPFEEIFAALRENDENDEEGLNSLGKGAKAEILLADHDAYKKSCPFKAGDFITPKKHHNLRGAGDPNIVLEIFDRPPPGSSVLAMVVEGKANTRAWLPDMRILNVAGGVR